MNKEDNVVFVLQKAIKHFKIRVTETTVKSYLLAHPHYPSLKSVCDALTKWNVENYPLNLELKEIKALEIPFIAHLKSGGGQLVFVEEMESGQVTYFLSGNKKTEEDYGKFSEKLTGAVVVFEAGKDSGEKEYRQLRQNEILSESLLPLSIITLVAWAVLNFISNVGGAAYQSGYLFWGLLATRIIGLTASVFLVLHELKVHTPLADKICGFNSKTDCDTVLSSNASKIFGWINWADAGIIYFTGSLLYLAGTNAVSSFWILALVSTLALPYPVFSIYYQAVKTKKWCPFCLIVQVVLITEFMLLLPVLQQVTISVIQVLQLAVSFLVPAVLWFLFKANHNTIKEHNKVRYSFLGFKRNPKIFRFLLRNNGQEEIPITQNSLVLGNPNAPVTVTAFLSLYCNPCANAFKHLKELLENCPELKINAVFSVYDDEVSKKLINTLYNVYKSKGTELTIDFLYKWYTIPKQNRKILCEKEQLPEGFDITEPIARENKKLFDEHRVAGTPSIFVNGYKYPSKYEYSDVEYYMDELKKLHVESNPVKHTGTIGRKEVNMQR
jgi:uncharacterized membrane protein